jgi:hypothetical protein
MAGGAALSDPFLNRIHIPHDNETGKEVSQTRNAA